MYATRVLAVLFAFLLLCSASFAVDASAGGRPQPVPFDTTVRVGMTGAETSQARAADYAIPKAEVFYAQYRHVVGYYGVPSLVEELGREGATRQFGTPLAIYVTDFAGTGASVTGDGFLTVRTDSTGWVPATEAYFVLGSDARTPAGPAVVPFSSRSAAAGFADTHGGDVRRWDALRRTTFGLAEATRDRMTARVADRTAWADRAVAEATPLLDRPVSVVVGRDAPSVRAAVDRAPANTTVYVPEGTYRVDLTVEKPVTLRGAGADTVLRGNGTGSVVRVRAPGVAVADLHVDGVGERISRAESPDGETRWDERVRQGYGTGDAGVVFEDANGSLAHGVTVDTPANGLLIRGSDGTVVTECAVRGTEDWADGAMGVMVMTSRVVVQDSAFRGGRDGVYTHRAHGSVIRRNSMEGLRFGVHEMYTSHTLVENNTARETNVGVIVMTRPTGNAVLANDVRDSQAGLSVAGSASYVAGNLLVDNAIGLEVVSYRSMYERNVLARNERGIRDAVLLPTNRVVANDFVDNGRHAVARLGPVRVWSAGGEGNYWTGAPGEDRDGDGILERPFHPTGPVDGIVHRVPGSPTVARSPAHRLLRGLGHAVPGLRDTGVVDLSPRASPVRPGVAGGLNATGEA